MNIAFTLCSINYLGQAQTLYNSLHKSNPGWKLIIGLVDKNVHHADLSSIKGEILEVEELDIDGFEEMVSTYSIVELITAVKPSYFIYLLNHYPAAEKIIYFDPDIMVFGSLNSLENKLERSDIILSPHLTTPITDEYLPTEKHIFDTGVFNLGFLAVKRSPNTLNMLQWWAEKLRHSCFVDLSRGLFVDQIWMNIVPAYFDRVLIDKCPGYNMAHWNLHEREITGWNNGYMVNGEPLVFFHFSHYNPSKPNEIAAFHTRYTFKTRPDLLEIFHSYHHQLLENNYFGFKKISCYYMHNEGKKKFRKSFRNFFRHNLPVSVKMRLKPILNS